MAQSVLSIRMDEETKEAFALFCERAGMSVSTAINLFVKQTVRDQRMPFVVSVQGSNGDRDKRVPTARSIEEVVRRVASKYPQIDRVTLFGSFARNEAGPNSDIDLRVEYDESGTFTMLDLAGFSDQVRYETGREVDVVSRRRIDNPSLDQAIRIEGTVLYER